MDLINKNIGQIVADDYRTATVFKNHGIDFCCNGNRSLAEASESRNVPLEALTIELLEVTRKPAEKTNDHQSWPPDLLADYIERIHHRYVTEKSPEISQYLDKLCRVHGNRHPELFEIKALFLESTGELAMHMKKEELILFPRIKKMVKAQQEGTTLDAPAFGTVENPIRMMMLEHDTEGGRFRKIAELSNEYLPPADACNTYRVTFALLREFETDLHQHIHLENNILFPKAIALEEALNRQI